MTRNLVSFYDEKVFYSVENYITHELCFDSGMGFKTGLLHLNYDSEYMLAVL